MVDKKYIIQACTHCQILSSSPDYLPLPKEEEKNLIHVLPDMLS